jgi:aspartate/methionine/tyrosine aminotransferase
MRRWVFEDALGRYDIDLGDSHVHCATFGQLQAPPGELVLDYGVDRGGAELRRLVAGLYGGAPDSVLVTHGAQEALFLLLSTLLSPGDTVVTVQPGWRQAVDLPGLLGCRVEVVPLGRDLAVDVDRITAVADHARVIVITSPSNPTGLRTGPAQLRALADLVEHTGGWLVLDEEYRLDLSGSLAVDAERVVSVSSLSKIFGMPGLRTGWMYGPRPVVDRCAERKHLTTISNSVLTEALACGIISRREAYAAEYERLCRHGLHLLAEWAERRAGAVRLVEPEGTPFAWMWLDTGESSLSFCRRVLETRVLLMPGDTVGASGGVRVTFARDAGVLAEGLRRVGTVLDTTDATDTDATDTMSGPTTNGVT